jgi:hypothetical protein
MIEEQEAPSVLPLDEAWWATRPRGRKAQIFFYR